MPDYKSNSYDDDDMEAVLQVLDEKDGEADKIMASARGKVGAIRKWQKAEIKRARDELGIPIGVLKPLRKMRGLERQMQRVTDEVSEDLIEVFEDAAGQFSLFATEEASEPAPPGVKAAKKTKAQQQNEDDEQSEGAGVLEGGVH